LPHFVDLTEANVERNWPSRALPSVGPETRFALGFDTPASGIGTWGPLGRGDGVNQNLRSLFYGVAGFGARKHVNLAQRPGRTVGFGEAKERPRAAGLALL
jgi:hypothetical protein